MSYQSMAFELTGIVPKLPPDYANTIIKRAWRDVRRQNLWSFQIFDSNWTSPTVVNAGTVAVTQGSNQIVFDSTASPAILAIGFVPSSVTQRQFRVGIGTIYNIWALTNNGGIVTLTLDRNYQEPTSAATGYQIYQCYYVAPYQDFWQWKAIRDTINFNNLNITKTRDWIDRKDPQRSIYYIPDHVVPYTTDKNPVSATLGWQLFELWAQPQYVLTYQLWGLRKGPELVNPTDELPFEIGEDVVMALSRAYAYQWAEANKRDARMMGSDFRFLIQDAKADYKRLFAEYRRQDRAKVDNFQTKLRRASGIWNLDGYYSSVSGYAGPGAPWA